MTRKVPQQTPKLSGFGGPDSVSAEETTRFHFVGELAARPSDLSGVGPLIEPPPMKKKLSAQIVCLSLALFLPIICGCAMFGGGEQAAEADRVAVLARIASYIGTANHLAAKPEDAPKFQLVRNAVDSLLLGESVDLASLHEALSQLPIGELRGNKAAILVTSGFLLLEGMSGEREPIKTPEQVKALATAIRDGIGMALNTAPATAKK